MNTPIVGIIGGGQLARMAHQAAIALGVQTVVLCPDDDAPAVAAGARHIPGRADSLADLVSLAEHVDVITVEHERTPAALLEQLAILGHRVAPSGQAAGLGQNKAAARQVLGAHGIDMAPWLLSDDRSAIESFAERHGWPLILKVPSGGYDGRGVWTAANAAAVDDLLAATNRPMLVEPRLAFTHELSVIVVRSDGGPHSVGPEVVAYPPFETVQRSGQCTEVLAPAPVPSEVAVQARSVALTVADTIGLIGSMAVELFVVGDNSVSAGHRLLLNELAVRPHNSGHLTIEACHTSQFENHLRAILGWPLGSTDLRVGAACMRNILGPADGTDPFIHQTSALAIPGANLHHYAKTPRPDRKLGHITATASHLDDARAIATQALEAMEHGAGWAAA